MPLARAVSLLLCLLSLGTSPVASASPVPEVIEHLIGSWEGEGELFGRPARFSMSWSWTLEQQFVELRFENRLVQEDGSAQKVLEAVALYRVTDDGALSGTWFDSRGQVVELSAAATADALSTHWTADTEEGRTTYRVIDADTVEVEDHVLGEEGWRPFGSAVYRKTDG